MHALLFTAPLLLIAPTPSASSSHTQIVAFGDSLSDNGNYFASASFPPSPYWQGRFTNGRVWVEQLANHLGLDAAAIEDRAVGFAPTADVLNLQVLPWLTASGAADPNALYTYWAGANDLFDLLASGGDPQLVIGGAMQNTADALLALLASGAQRIVVLNLPDLSLTPFARELGPPAQLQIQQLTQGYNAALAQTLSALEFATGFDFVEVDAFALIQELDAAPQDFGLKYAGERALSATGDLAQRTENFLFWDHVHPTARGHSFVMGEVLAQLGVLWGDVNGDGQRSGEDLLALMQSYGPSAPGARADMDGDGVVDLRDLHLLRVVLK